MSRKLHVDALRLDYFLQTANQLNRGLANWIATKRPLPYLSNRPVSVSRPAKESDIRRSATRS